MEIKEIKQWFELAVPVPTDKSRAVQIGCHYEEFSEMAVALDDDSLAARISKTADGYKENMIVPIHFWDKDEKLDLLDALCDQIVTAIGVAHMFGFDIEGALKEVNRSNFSKFIDGKPVFNEQGKIAKPASYSPPRLTPYIGEQK